MKKIQVTLKKEVTLKELNQVTFGRVSDYFSSMGISVEDMQNTFMDVENFSRGYAVTFISKDGKKNTLYYDNLNLFDVVELEIQEFTSKETSINGKKLPASTKKIPFEIYRGKNILDFGGGKFDNLKDYLKREYDINLFIYDKFNRTDAENFEALGCRPSAIICNNVLNVIQEDEIIQIIANLIQAYNVPYFVSVYNGTGSGSGKKSKNDCYQRHEKTKEYLKFFKGANLVKNVIVGLKKKV